MSDLFDILQERYQALIARKEDDEKAKGGVEEEFLDDVRAFIADARQAGAALADLDERSQLRAWMRFLAHVPYDATSVYPDVTLQPLARGRLLHPRPEHRERPSPAFPLAWMLVGGAAAVVIALGLVAIGWLSRPAEVAEETPTPVAMPVPLVLQSAVGTELDPGGTVMVTADTFCLGTPEIIAQFTLEGLPPETQYRWELQREGQVVQAQPATPWGREEQPVTVRIGGPEGVDPGQYDLLLYVGEGVVGVRSFRVLGTAPRVFDLRLADVPEPAGEPADRSDGNEFDAGVRVIYLDHEVEGFCPGLDVSYTLYQEGEPLQERVEPWAGAPQDQAQVSFQAPGDRPFSPGDYEVAIAVAGEEQPRVGFTIDEDEEEEEATTAPVPPAFGDVTVALGVGSDGTPLLPAPEDRFDWNTKAVYGFFDYVGMSDGLRWTAVWTRNDQEVAREERFWDVETYGTEGTRWVAYHDGRGGTLPGGTYRVTLYIENVAQRTAEFDILYYVPPE